MEMKDFEDIFKIIKLIRASIMRELKKEEKDVLNSWLNSSEENRELYKSLIQEDKVPQKVKELEIFDKEAAYKKFAAANYNKTRQITLQILKYAAVLIPLVVAVYFVFRTEKVETSGIEFADVNIHPGTSKAILRLDDGTTINLEDKNQKITEDDGTQINTDTKKVVYSSDSKKNRKREIKFNAIEIPRGGEFQLTLSDGTQVWLNSETVIRYPVSFPDDIRDVYVQGEAYFEVTPNKNAPFVVHTSNMTVNVLGTGFNVRDYSDENRTVTTLVHGQVAIQGPNDTREFVLRPSEQAIFAETGGTIRSVDVQQFTAWKEGRIYYEDNTLDDIFTDLSRWYNISVDYENEDLKSLRFSIDVRRYNKFSEILEIINLTKKVKLKINENQITVLKI